MSSKTFNPFKDFQSDQIQRSSLKIFTAHYACRNSDLNLTLVTGTTNGFIFQIINSLMESWGVCLTCLNDCNFQQITFKLGNVTNVGHLSFSFGKAAKSPTVGPSSSYKNPPECANALPPSQHQNCNFL